MPFPGTALFPSPSLYPGDGGIELAPVAITGGASDMTQTTARLAGSIDPNDFQTHYYFEYGNRDGYGYVSPTWIAGTIPLNVSRVLKHLTSATFYHYRLVAFSAAGSTYGEDKTFITEYGPHDAIRSSFVHEANWSQ